MLRGFLLFLAGLVIGAGLTILMGRETPKDPPLACRPSAPSLAAAEQDFPVILMLGNSLIHDHDWQVPRYFPVNCGRQGLTAKRMVPLIERLPEMAPDVIFVWLGTVEAAQAAASGKAVDAEAFGQAFEQVLLKLREAWPSANLLAATLPHTTSVDAGDAAQLNNAIRVAALVAGSPGLRLIEVSEVLSAYDGTSTSYDGIHLEPPAYALLEKIVSDTAISIIENQ